MYITFGIAHILKHRDAYNNNIFEEWHDDLYVHHFLTETAETEDLGVDLGPDEDMEEYQEVPDCESGTF